MDELERRVREGQLQGWQAQLNALRQQLIGSGERGDKLKTYREQDGIVTNHRTGEKRRLAEVEAGRLR
jgi:protein subunit release factor A